MTEMRMGPKYPERPFEFIEERKRNATKEVVDGVTQLLTESHDLEYTFTRLWRNRLAGSRHIYETLEDLRKRDEAVQQKPPATLPTESAQRRARLIRPDLGQPSQLEYWLYTLIPSAVLKKLCEDIPERLDVHAPSGALSVRSSIENVLGDEPRTQKMIAAVRHHVRALGKGPMTIYDVGCGPFPILAIAAAIANPDADIVCVEINPLSAAIARHVLRSLDKTGKSRRGKIEVVEGDATTMPLDPNKKIDLLFSETTGPALFDEQIGKILPRFSEKLNAQRGIAVPSRVRISAGLVPVVYKGILESDNARYTAEKVRFERDRLTGKHAKKPERRYGLVLDTNGIEHLVQPDDEWTELSGPDGIDLTKPIPPIRGRVPLPSGVSLADFNNNYSLAVSLELLLDKAGKRVIERYHSMITMPVTLGIVTVPDELKNTVPSELAIEFEYTPGDKSGIKAGRVRIVKI